LVTEEPVPEKPADKGLLDDPHALPHIEMSDQAPHTKVFAMMLQEMKDDTEKRVSLAYLKDLPNVEKVKEMPMCPRLDEFYDAVEELEKAIDDLNNGVEAGVEAGTGDTGNMDVDDNNLLSQFDKANAAELSAPPSPGNDMDDHDFMDHDWDDPMDPAMTGQDNFGQNQSESSHAAGDGNNSFSPETQSYQGEQQRREESSFTDLIGGTEYDENLTDYFDPRLMMRCWAGPNQWSHRRMQFYNRKRAEEKKDKGNDDKENAPKRKRAKKEPNYVKFEECVETSVADDEWQEPSNQNSKKNKNLMSERLQTKNNDDYHVLPKDLHLTERDTFRRTFMNEKFFRTPFFHKKVRQSEARRPAEQQQQYDEEEVEDPQAEDYSFRAAPGGVPSEPDDDNDCNRYVSDDEFDFFSQDFGNDYGAPATPMKLDKIRVNYTKKAKKVDVRALKGALYQYFEPDGKFKPEQLAKIDNEYVVRGEETQTQEPQTQEQITEFKDEEMDDVAEGTRNNPVNLEGKTFQTALSSLTKIFKGGMEEVTVPLCFTCLLYLCNEKDLELTKPEDNSIGDFMVGPRIPKQKPVEREDQL